MLNRVNNDSSNTVELCEWSVFPRLISVNDIQ